MIRLTRHFLHSFSPAFLFVCAPALAADTVMVFGDSLSAAYNLSVEQGWVHILARRIESAGLPWKIVNASVSGETTGGGLSRLPEDLRRHKPSIVVIELGANDALRGLPIAGMQKNLGEIVRLARQARAEPVLVGMMIPPNYGIDYAAQFHAMYGKLAAQSSTPVVPFLLEGLADKPEYFQSDQLHPTAAAQGRIADTVWKTLEPLMKKKKAK